MQGKLDRKKDNLVEMQSRLVTAKSSYDSEVVRKKAVMCLHRFYQVQPACVADGAGLLRASARQTGRKA